MGRTRSGKYTAQQPPRKRVEPPHLTLRDARTIAGLTLDQLIAKLQITMGDDAPKRGTLSAIETGIRGASPALLDEIALAFNLRPGSFLTTCVAGADEVAA